MEQMIKLEKLADPPRWRWSTCVSCGQEVKRLKLQPGRVVLSLQGSESLEQIVESLLEGLDRRSGTNHPARLSGSFAVLKKCIE